MTADAQIASCTSLDKSPNGLFATIPFILLINRELAA